jgi:hypothetical protein
MQLALATEVLCYRRIKMLQPQGLKPAENQPTWRHG